MIERFCQFIINECLYSKSYANFADFKAGISNCIATANTDKQKKLNSLLTLEFNIFKKVQLLAV
ncbi:Mobile element protein [Richelia intracellularis]|nr:Mobile element protein [Richelia intracellularis]